MAEAENLPDIDHGLASLTEETTAAEFLRSKGQNKKVKTINKDKLKQWIGQAIMQSRAATAGAYNDEEKEELLKKTQSQLEEVMARAAKAEGEVKQREQQKMKMQREIADLQTQSAGESANEGEQLKQAMATVAKLQMEYEQAHRESDDLRLDVYELQDQLNTKMALSRTTMEEKDRLKVTMQGLMVRAGDLSGGVLQLDQAYYAGRHGLENEIPEDIEMTEQFFHDFEVGSKVIESLSADLEKLREITESQAEAGGDLFDQEPAGLLSRDLELLEQLKAGSLDAVDVAQPVAGLIEALEGARVEANTLESEAAAAMGVPQAATTVSALPDADGEAATVIAGATMVARELATLFAKERNRLQAMQAMADNADEERNSEEEANASLETFYTAILLKLSYAATAAGLEPDAVLEDTAADPGEKHAAAGQLIEVLSATPDESTQAVVDSYDALLASIAKDAEEAGVDIDSALSDSTVEPVQRQQAAEQVLDALADKNNEDVQKSYEALLACIADELTEVGADTPSDLINDEAEAVQRQAAAEEALHVLREQSQGARDAEALQEQLEEALQDVSISDADIILDESADVSLDDATVARRDQHAARVLSANRIGLLVGRIKDLQHELERTQADAANDGQQAKDLQQALQQRIEEQAANTTVGEAETQLARSIMSAVQGDEELAGDDSVLDLALVIDDYSDELSDDDDDGIIAHCEKVVIALAERKQALMTELATMQAGQMDRDNKMAEVERSMQEANSERDEMAESGREVIAQLTQQRDVKAKELEEAKSSIQEARSKLSVLEDTVHTFANRLQDLVDDEQDQSPELAAAKAQARDAVSAMPGEKTVPLSAEVADAVCHAGVNLLQILAADGGASAVKLQQQLEESVVQLEGKADLLVAQTQALEQLESTQAAAVAQTEKDQVAIAALSEQQESLKNEQQELQAQLACLAEMEESHREVAQEIAALAGVIENNEDIGTLRADLEVTLSELPEDEAETMRDGLHKDIGLTGRAILDAIKQQLLERGQQVQQVSGERDELKDLLRDSKAAIEEYRARNQESLQSNDIIVKNLKDKVSQLENAKDGNRKEMQAQIDDYRLEENVLKKKLAELSKQIEARDQEITLLKKDSDAGADQNVEISRLQVQTEALENELRTAKAKVQEFESEHSALGGREEFSLGALQQEIAILRTERDEIHGRIRGIEDELATEKSRVASLKEDRQELRSEFEREQEEIKDELAREKAAHEGDVEESQKLRSDLAGVQARLRSITESD